MFIFCTSRYYSRVVLRFDVLAEVNFIYYAVRLLFLYFFYSFMYFDAAVGNYPEAFSTVVPKILVRMYKLSHMKQ